METMTFVKINGQQYPALVRGRTADAEWNNRESKATTLEMTYEEAAATFQDDIPWSILYQAPSYSDDSGNVITPETEEYDNSEYDIAGPITDNRDGTVTVKMGKITAEEALTELMEVLADEA